MRFAEEDQSQHDSNQSQETYYQPDPPRTRLFLRFVSGRGRSISHLRGLHRPCIPARPLDSLDQRLLPDLNHLGPRLHNISLNFLLPHLLDDPSFLSNLRPVVSLPHFVYIRLVQDEPLGGNSSFLRIRYVVAHRYS